MASAVATVVLLVIPSPAHGDEPLPVGTWPLDPRPEVVATFDPPEDPWGAGHRGVDLAGRIGQPVRAALPGTVAFAGRIAGRPVVSVSHGDTRTTYEPVVASVEVGTAVAAGDVVGVLELPGSHCFPRACLHWGWRRGETYLDPLDLVGGGPVRLLPLWRDAPVATGGWRPPVHPYAAWAPWSTTRPSPVAPAPLPLPVPPPGGRTAGYLP
ncbi:M23 family metallopeptidase [Nocardioides sp. Soil805]|uniref:M23 family metallopeptidase n=1 Tax=Nocardioides sp. Soil805 TaxID=1736416 RepID=UPI000ADC87BC|nr:M23 family metallopeptidase [Nocardioides sp. Soil805]